MRIPGHDCPLTTPLCSRLFASMMFGLPARPLPPRDEWMKSRTRRPRTVRPLLPRLPELFRLRAASLCLGLLCCSSQAASVSRPAVSSPSSGLPPLAPRDTYVKLLFNGDPSTDTKLQWLSAVTKAFHLQQNLAEIKMAADTSRFVYISRQRSDIIDRVKGGEFLGVSLTPQDSPKRPKKYPSYILTRYPVNVDPSLASCYPGVHSARRFIQDGAPIARIVVWNLPDPPPAVICFDFLPCLLPCEVHVSGAGVLGTFLGTVPPCRSVPGVQQPMTPGLAPPGVMSRVQLPLLAPRHRRLRIRLSGNVRAACISELTCGTAVLAVKPRLPPRLHHHPLLSLLFPSVPPLLQTWTSASLWLPSWLVVQLWRTDSPLWKVGLTPWLRSTPLLGLNFLRLLSPSRVSLLPSPSSPRKWTPLLHASRDFVSSSLPLAYLLLRLPPSLLRQASRDTLVALQEYTVTSSWQRFTDSINQQTSVASMWHLIRRVKKTPATAPP
ncbi:hypothetical protein E2C01_055209 [Portunus trituberculatus]|uniref:Uncharacterized protein n=1 Tax=Portunus trituberculatus TaxID=210409 RepID=A0A5B7GUN5_PORTR|nr:hypothetical protein [Portunus trituberculatus]